jgi:fatty-acyl-CoA synthase
MKLAFSNLGAPGWSIETLVREATRMGYDGVELRLLEGEVIDPVRDHTALRAAVDRCRGAGLDVCALDTSCRFNIDDPAERDRQVQALLAWIEVAHELGVFGGAPPDAAAVDDEVANGWVAQALAAAAPQAEQAGVTVALETHDAFSSARRVSVVLDAVNSSRIGAVWDSHHPYEMGESAEQVIAFLGARLAHVHVKDARRAAPGSSDWELVPIGEGEIPIRAQLDALRASGYDGYVSVEWEKKWHPELAEPEVALPQHIAWLREALGSGEKG